MIAPLPEASFKLPLRAFERVEVDYRGFLTQQGRRRVKTKRYLCLFTCLNTRAVHFEMAYTLDTDCKKGDANAGCIGQRDHRPRG